MYDVAFTCGCFDWLHRGHVNLLEYMRRRAHRVVVFMHTDSAVRALKGTDLVQTFSERMCLVSKYADVVIDVEDTDPTSVMRRHVPNYSSNCVYIRADDMKEFPGRVYIESKMPIDYIPYTHGVSSTYIRSLIRDSEQTIRNNITNVLDA